MCKVFAIADMSRVRHLKQLVNVVSKHIMKTDDDGFGWAALGMRGVFGERTCNNFHYYKFESRREKVKLPIIKETYNKFGLKGDLVGPGIFHGRTSTNEKSLLNTHPIIKNDWTLIHNGVVTNNGPKYVMDTSNDTEHLVQYMSTTGISDVEKYLSGYYAFAAIDPQGRMHIVRDSVASLYVAEIPTIQSYVFGTTVDLIESICKAMKWKCGQVDMLLENQHLMFEGNEMIYQETIKPLGYGRRESSYASSSLGREITNYGGWSEHGGTSYGYTGKYDREFDRTWNRKERDDSGLLLKGNVIDASNKSWQERVEERMVTEEEDSILDAYVKAVSEVTSEYTIMDQGGNIVEYEDFKKFDLHSKMCMNIIKPDGEVLTPPEFMEELGYGS